MLEAYLDAYRRHAERICGRHYVPRLRVVEKLLDILEAGPVLVHGPRGSGKSILLRCMAVSAAREGLRGVYVNLYTAPPIVIGRTGRAGIELARKASVENAAVRGSLIGRLAATLGRGSLVVIDGFDWMMQGRPVELLRSLVETLSLSGCNCGVVLVASSEALIDALSTSAIHGVTLALLWHLKREEHTRLLEGLGWRGDTETVYRVTGGSPRAVYELYRLSWRISEWLVTRIKPLVYHVLIRVLEQGLLSELSKRPDDVGSRSLLRKVLLESDILASLEGVHLEEPEDDEWVGRRWAWQLPAYLQVYDEVLKELPLRRHRF